MNNEPSETKFPIIRITGKTLKMCITLIVDIYTRRMSTTVKTL